MVEYRISKNKCLGFSVIDPQSKVLSILEYNNGLRGASIQLQK